MNVSPCEWSLMIWFSDRICFKASLWNKAQFSFGVFSAYRFNSCLSIKAAFAALSPSTEDQGPTSGSECLSAGGRGGGHYWKDLTMGDVHPKWGGFYLLLTQLLLKINCLFTDYIWYIYLATISCIYNLFSLMLKNVLSLNGATK